MNEYFCHCCENVFCSNIKVILCKNCDSEVIVELRDSRPSSPFEKINVIPSSVDTGDLIEFDCVITEYDNKDTDEYSKEIVCSKPIPESSFLFNEEPQEIIENDESTKQSDINIEKKEENSVLFKHEPEEAQITNQSTSPTFHSEYMNSNSQTMGGSEDRINLSRVSHSTTEISPRNINASSPVFNSQSVPINKTNRGFLSMFKIKPKGDSFIKSISMKATNFSEREECSICLRKYKSTSNVRLTQCAHKFHEECLLTWLKMKKECPICRSQFKVNII